MSEKPKLPTLSGTRPLQTTGARAPSLDAIAKRFEATVGAPKSGAFAILIDATGSMGEVIENTKRHIHEIIRRARQTAGNGDIKVRFFAYRDYDDASTLLQISDLSSDAGYLKGWLAGVSAIGGGDHEEATEHALRHAHDALDKDHYRAVLVVGDAKPRTAAQLRDRQRMDVTAQDWAMKLAARDCRVHTFWVPGAGGNADDHAAFKEIAYKGNGICGKLDGSEEFLHMASMSIVERLGGAVAVRKYATEHALPAPSRQFQQLLLEKK